MDLNRKVDQSAYTNEMPEYPARVLTTHCAMKGVQLGSILGTAILTPAYAFYRKVPLGSSLRTCAFPGTLLGVALSLSMLYAKDYNGSLDVAGVDDRAYRLVHNEGQVKVDQYSVIGAAAGATAGAVLGR